MEGLKQLQHLSLVGKGCQELENHLGMGDKTLAEFIISMGKQHSSVKGFAQELAEAGAEMPESFVGTLLTIIQKMSGSGTGGGTGAAKQVRW